jgi:hypothetical protein
MQLYQKAFNGLLTTQRVAPLYFAIVRHFVSEVKATIFRSPTDYLTKDEIAHSLAARSTQTKQTLKSPGNTTEHSKRQSPGCKEGIFRASGPTTQSYIKK